jgi:chromosome partitioning protein
MIDDIAALVAGQARELAGQLTLHRQKAHPPAASKEFRRLAPLEVARLLGVVESRLRQIASDHGIGELVNSRRSYTLDDLDALRRAFAAGARTPERYLPKRRPDEPVQIIATMNFKGGSAKTTTCAHLAQYLALRGYRVLAVDLDPQASLSALFGVHSVMDVEEGDTIYGAIRVDDGHESARRPLRDIIRRTYMPGLDLVPGGLEVMEFEHEAPRAMASGKRGEAAAIFDVLSEAFAGVSDDYDVIVVDCPPQLGYITLAGLVAATSVLITVHPQMLDVMSMSEFLAMLSDLMGVILDALPSAAQPRYHWLRYLITRFEPHDGPQMQMAAFLRSLFGHYVLQNSTLKSTAISDAGLTNQTIYEVERGQFTRATYDRAVESVDAVNREVEELILATWGRIPNKQEAS